MIDASKYEQRAVHIENRVRQAEERITDIWAELGNRIAGLEPGLTHGEMVAQLTREAIAEEAELSLWLRVGLGAERNGYAMAMAIVCEALLEELLTNGADDTWSGRGNDVRRIRHDARRAWLVAQRRA